MSQTKHFIALDALRGLSAWTIIIYHVWDVFPAYVLVDFFLALSGFVLSYRYLYLKPVNFRTFLVHRFARLYPLHVFTLITWGLAYFIANGSPPNYSATLAYGSLFAHIFLLNGVGLGMLSYTWNFPAWTISGEYWVNALFARFVTLKTPVWPMALIPVVCYGIIYINAGHPAQFVQNYYGIVNSGLLRVAGSFTAGIVLFRAYLWVRGNERWIPLVRGLQLPVFTLVVAHQAFSPETRVAADFLALPVLYFMILSFAFDEKGFARLTHPLKYIGDLSYSLYMNHMSVIVLLTGITGALKTEQPVLFGTLVMVTVTLYSAFTYERIERPAQRAVLKRMLD